MTKRTKQSIDAQIKKMVKIDLEPWPQSVKDDLVCVTESMESNLRALRIAVDLMTKSKASLVEFSRKQPNASREIYDCLKEARESQEESARLLSAAAARVLCAWAVVAETEQSM